MNKILVFKYNNIQINNYGYCGIDKIKFNSDSLILISFINNKFYVREISTLKRRSESKFDNESISANYKIFNKINEIKKRVIKFKDDHELEMEHLQKIANDV